MKTYVNVDDLIELARGTDCYYQIRGIIGNKVAEKISIVECKNCIYSDGKIYDDRYVWCDAFQTEVPEDWFCASGVNEINYDKVM